jgi:acetolactate synthase-1/2/3 large subunit
MVKMSQQFAIKPLKTMIKKTLSPEETYGTELGEVAWDRVAEAMGAHGERVKDPADLRPALERCLASGRCSVVQAEVDPVKHLWAPGLQDFKKMHQEPGG